MALFPLVPMTRFSAIRDTWPLLPPPPPAPDTPAATPPSLASVLLLAALVLMAPPAPPPPPIDCSRMPVAASPLVMTRRVSPELVLRNTSPALEPPPPCPPIPKVAAAVKLALPDASPRLVTDPPAPPPPPTDWRKTPIDWSPLVSTFPERRALTSAA